MEKTLNSSITQDGEFWKGELPTHIVNYIWFCHSTLRLHMFGAEIVRYLS